MSPSPVTLVPLKQQVHHTVAHRSQGSWSTARALQPPKQPATHSVMAPSLPTPRSPLGSASQPSTAPRHPRQPPAQHGGICCRRRCDALLPTHERWVDVVHLPSTPSGLVFGCAGSEERGMDGEPGRVVAPVPSGFADSQGLVVLISRAGRCSKVQADVGWALG